MSKGVQVVVGEFELLKGDELAAPMRPGGGRVRMDVEPPGHRGLCLPRYRPITENGETLTISGSQWFVWRRRRPVLPPPAAEDLSGALIRQNAPCL